MSSLADIHWRSSGKRRKVLRGVTFFDAKVLPPGIPLRRWDPNSGKSSQSPAVRDPAFLGDQIIVVGKAFPKSNHTRKDSSRHAVDFGLEEVF